MYLVLLSIAALAAGPLLHRAARGRGEALALLDGFVLVSLAGLLLVHILPHSIAMGGWVAVPAMAAGMVIPLLVERFTEGRALRVAGPYLVIALVAIALHATMDGAMMVDHHEDGHGEGALLGLGVVLHRVPVGLTIWWLVRPRFGMKGAVVVAATLAVFTVVGFQVGETALSGLEGTWLAVFQSAAFGSLLHVAFHHAAPQGHACDDGCGHGDHHHDHGSQSHHHHHDHAHHAGPGDHSRAADNAPLAAPPYTREQVAVRRGSHRAAGLGGFLGVALTYALVRTHPIARRLVDELDLGTTFVTLSLESAPALLLAYLAAGLVHGFMPGRSLSWLRRGSVAAQAARGVAIGPLLPLCSCGVVPIYRSLIAKRTPATAAIALLVAAPELSVGAVLVSFSLLGTKLSLARCACAAVTAWLAGAIVGRVADRRANRRFPSVPPAPLAGQPPLRRLTAGLRTSLVDDVDHTAPWILFGLGLAAFLEPLVRGSWLLSLSAGLDVPLAALIGIPLYVCASGATPLVAVLLHKGLSPGAAVVFLLVGPATNLTTFGLLSRMHGPKVAALFALVMFSVACALGILVNVTMGPSYGFALHEVADENHPWFEYVSLVLVAALWAASVLRQGPRAFVRQIATVHDHDDGHKGLPDGERVHLASR